MPVPLLVGVGTGLIAKKVLSSLGKKYALKASKKFLVSNFLASSALGGAGFRIADDAMSNEDLLGGRNFEEWRDDNLTQEEFNQYLMSIGNDPAMFFNTNPAGYSAELDAWAERLFNEAMDAVDEESDPDGYLKKIDEMSDEEVNGLTPEERLKYDNAINRNQRVDESAADYVVGQGSIAKGFTETLPNIWGAKELLSQYYSTAMGSGKRTEIGEQFAPYTYRDGTTFLPSEARNSGYTVLGFEPITYYDATVDQEKYQNYVQENPAFSAPEIGPTLGPRISPGQERFRTWEFSEQGKEAGIDYAKVVMEDQPLTFTDAMVIYDAQTPDTQKLIAESLALTGLDQMNSGQSYMQSAVGNLMFTDPNIIYERDSVLSALQFVAAEASTSMGMYEDDTDVGDRYIPKLRASDFDTESMTVNSFQDNLFDLALKTKALTTITPALSQDLFKKVYFGLTGRAPNEETQGLVRGWTRDFQRETMGETNLSQSDFAASYSDDIEENYGTQIEQNQGFVARQTLKKIIAEAV